MDQAGVVRGFQSRGDLHRDRTGFEGRDRAALETLREVFALDEFHHEEANAVALLEAIDGGDVRVLQARERSGFALEAGLAFRVCRHLGRQHLEGDLTVQLGVAGAEYLAHAALAQFGGDLVVGEQSSDQVFVRSMFGTGSGQQPRRIA